MERLIFFLNSTPALKKLTKIRNETGEGRKSIEIKWGRKGNLTVGLFELIIKLNENPPLY